MLAQFKEFLSKTNALALAIGVIIGAAAGGVVKGVVDDLLMPIISMLIPGGDWKSFKIVLGTIKNAKREEVQNAILIGDFLGVVVNFLIISYVVFLIAKLFIKEAPAVATKECPFCKESNAEGATKCKACASAI
jgi:large conductance mechanosensitive channel